MKVGFSMENRLYRYHELTSILKDGERSSQAHRVPMTSQGRFSPERRQKHRVEEPAPGEWNKSSLFDTTYADATSEDSYA